MSRPHQFDVMVLPNLYGNIITSIGAGLIGGAGLVSGVNLGEKYAVFETVGVPILDSCFVVCLKKGCTQSP